MAWKFLDETKSSNKKYREEMMHLINSWWGHFQNKRKNIEAYLDGRGHLELEDFMADSLQSIEENLMWEFGTESGAGHYQLVITPETERHLRPLVETIIAAAPKLANWTFYAYRQPHGVEQTRELVNDDTGIPLDDLSFSAASDDEHLINLKFSYRGAQSKESVADAVFMATEYLLGEEILDRWIGNMDIVDSGPELTQMPELPNTVTDLISRIQKSLPDQPLCTIRSTLKAQEITVEPHDDEEDETDIVWARTLQPKVWQAAHGESAFDSCRFSRHNEKFCYLKLDGVTVQEKLSELENRINEALNKEALGCTLGTARGQRFGYIDLCLTDPAKAIPVLKDLAQAKSHLQFFDTDWSDESVAL